VKKCEAAELDRRSSSPGECPCVTAPACAQYYLLWTPMLSDAAFCAYIHRKHIALMMTASQTTAGRWTHAANQWQIQSVPCFQLWMWPISSLRQSLAEDKNRAIFVPVLFSAAHHHLLWRPYATWCLMVTVDFVNWYASHATLTLKMHQNLFLAKAPQQPLWKLTLFPQTL